MKRVLALDIGEKRIGLAVSDPLQITAQGLETYHRCGDLDADIDYLIDKAKSFAPVLVLFGLPRNMNGSYGPQAQMVRDFADAFQSKWQGEIDFYDERLTTVTAEKVLIEADVSRAKRKNVIDKLAAVVILQGYLDSRG